MLRASGRVAERRLPTLIWRFSLPLFALYFSADLLSPTALRPRTHAAPPVPPRPLSPPTLDFRRSPRFVECDPRALIVMRLYGLNKQLSASSSLKSRTQHQPAGSRDMSHELWIEGSARLRGQTGNADPSGPVRWLMRAGASLHFLH